MKPRKSTIFVLLLTCFVFPFGMPFIFDPHKVGIFFGWEIGTILQTFYAFYMFAINEYPPHISDKKHKRNAFIILLPILISLFIYSLIKLNTYFQIPKYKILALLSLPESFSFRGEDFIISLFSDSITIVPMVVFFYLISYSIAK
jgi:hypothetical protein